MSSSAPIADGFEIVLRPDDMFHGMAELLGQLTVRDKHESDHAMRGSRHRRFTGAFYARRPSVQAAGALSCRRAAR